jgi:hypothetical protein
MQLSPCQHEPQLPNLEAALDHLDHVKPHLRLSAGVPSVEVRVAVTEPGRIRVRALPLIA